jgi:hypothetical protein
LKSTISPGNMCVFKQQAAQRDFSAKELQSTNCSARINRCPTVAKWRKGGEGASGAS